MLGYVNLVYIPVKLVFKIIDIVSVIKIRIHDDQNKYGVVNSQNEFSTLYPNPSNYVLRTFFFSLPKHTWSRIR